MKYGFDVADCSRIACSVKLIRMFASFTLYKARTSTMGNLLAILWISVAVGPATLKTWNTKMSNTVETPPSHNTYHVVIL